MCAKENIWLLVADTDSTQECDFETHPRGLPLVLYKPHAASAYNSQGQCTKQVGYCNRRRHSFFTQIWGG